MLHFCGLVDAGCGQKSCRLGNFLQRPTARQDKPWITLVPLPSPCLQPEFLCSPGVPSRREPLIQDFASGRKAEGSCFLQNSSETSCGCSRGIGIFDIPSRRGPAARVPWTRMHCSGGAGSLLQQPSSPVFCSAFF